MARSRSTLVSLGRTLATLLPLVAGTAARAHAVSVSPTALYIDSRTRSGVLTLFNSGTLPEEITVDFAYGYPQSDSAGNVAVATTKEPGPGEPSAMAWMRAFPRRLLLQPGQRQIVRVLVEPPADLPDGEYWARVLISSRGGQPPIEQTQGDVRLQLNVQTTLVMAANYRKGDLHTGATVTAASAHRTADGVQMQIDLSRTGNAAFLGHMRADLLDAGGNVLATMYDDLAVYRTMRRRLTFPAPPAGASGPFSVRIHVDTEREDLPPGGALPAAPIDQRIPVT
jgi:hypothetical protein